MDEEMLRLWQTLHHKRVLGGVLTVAELTTYQELRQQLDAEDPLSRCNSEREALEAEQAQLLRERAPMQEAIARLEFALSNKMRRIPETKETEVGTPGA